MLLLWKNLVLTKLDYCSQLWSPSSIGDVQCLEATQRSFTHKIREVLHLDYWGRIKALN